MWKNILEFIYKHGQELLFLVVRPVGFFEEESAKWGVPAMYLAMLVTAVFALRNPWLARRLLRSFPKWVHFTVWPVLCGAAFFHVLMVKRLAPMDNWMISVERVAYVVLAAAYGAVLAYVICLAANHFRKK
jgi:hypothetical protein